MAMSAIYQRWSEFWTWRAKDFPDKPQEVDDPKSFLARGQTCKRIPGCEPFQWQLEDMWDFRRIYIHIWICIYIYIHMWIYIYIYVYVYVYIYMYMYIYTHIICIYICIYIIFWVNDNNSLTWNIFPFWDDSPY